MIDLEQSIRKLFSIRLWIAAFLLGGLIGIWTGSTTVGIIVAIIVGILGILNPQSVLYCPHCRKRVKAGADACHHCGRTVRPSG